MNYIYVKCPKKCIGLVEANVDDGEGNAYGECDECGSRIGFHYTLTIEDIHIQEIE